MPIIKAGDINLEYYVEGEGPPLLLIMGFAGQASSWGEPIVERLRQHFTVIRFSSRGTGLSDKPETPTTINQMAEDAVALLDALNFDKVHVFGVSMGGMIAQDLVLNHPQRVNRLVIGCTTAGGATNETMSPEVGALMMPTPGLSREEQIRKAWPALCAPDFIENGQEFLEAMMVAGSKNPTPIDTLGKQMGAISGHDTTGRLAQIKTPTLVIHGDIDRLVPPSNGDRLAKGIPGAEHLTIHDSAHMFFWEKPDEAAGLVTEFLSRVPAEA
ncbi:MAG: alpha/beta fold hydrolase [Dehalococcoidia bacterium]